MTIKQKLFCDEYLIDLNATRAYKVAYPSVKNEASAGAASCRLLKNVKIQEYIKNRLAEKERTLIAKQDEVLQTLTRILRRQEEEVQVVTCRSKKNYIDNNGKRINEEKEEPICVPIPTKVSDVNRAAEMLGKYYVLFTDKTQVEGDGLVRIINNIPPTDDKT